MSLMTAYINQQTLGDPLFEFSSSKQYERPKVTVHALSSGSLTLPEHLFVTPSDPDTCSTVPSLSFLIQHTPSPTATDPNPKTTRIVFDLGIRRDLSLYSEPIRKHVESRKPLTTQPDVVVSLAAGGLGPDDIDMVFLSHVHWDHIGCPKDFERSRFVVGPGALDLLSGKTVLRNGSHSHFERDLLHLVRTWELRGLGNGTQGSGRPDDCERRGDAVAEGLARQEWKEFSLFPKTLDVFGDGSMYIVSAPGHLPGHINMLICGSDTAKPIYLAGDACHSPLLFDGTREIATWQEPDPSSTTPDAVRVCCIHADKVAAEKTLGRLRALARGEDPMLGEVEVVFAHDAAWEAAARRDCRFFPGEL